MKEIDLDLGGGQIARGFAALRKEGKGSEAGFALFRRNRLIQGSGDEGWKHAEVFGSPNSYRHQRLFGELHLVGFEVSHTKDGFRWADEAEFAQLRAVPRFLPAPTSPKTVKISTILELPGAVFYGDAINDQDLVDTAVRLQTLCADYESTDDHRTLRHELTREGFGHDENSEANLEPPHDYGLRLRSAPAA